MFSLFPTQGIPAAQWRNSAEKTARKAAWKHQEFGFSLFLAPEQRISG
jgi:hypothetical protein